MMGKALSRFFVIAHLNLIEINFKFHKYKMRMKGLEPSRPEALEPKSSASANSATSALTSLLYHKKTLFSRTIF